MVFELAETPIDCEARKRAMASSHAGACVTFEGWVRDHQDGRGVNALDYEAYAELALKEGQRVLNETAARFAIDAAVCVHRVGPLAIGDVAVWVGVTAAHRDAAFTACRYIIDEIKTRVPIWKKEHYADGAADWVNAERARDSTP